MALDRSIIGRRVGSIDDSTGERLATLELSVTLGDGTRTLIGEAVVALD
jgi:hypothetical protein